MNAVILDMRAGPPQRIGLASHVGLFRWASHR